MKKIRIAHLTSKALFSAMMLLSAGMYIFNHTEISNTFLGLGFPDYIVYPLAIAKILGLLALWFSKSDALKEWAYAGFFFNALLAFSAHVAVKDGEFPGALMALVLLAVSYITWKKMSQE